MDKQQLDEIRARDADDYAAADVLRNIRSAGNTDPELEATINMIADRHALLSAYDALHSRLAEAEALLQEVYDGRQSLMSVGLVYRIGHTLNHRPADSATHRETPVT